MSNNTKKSSTKTSTKSCKKTPRSTHDGWIVASVKGTHAEMGFQHGCILRHQINKIQPVLTYLVKKYYKTTLDEYVDRCRKLIFEGWQNIFDEIRGIAAGSGVSLDLLVAWNMFVSMNEIYESKTDPQRCSAFIATGSKTRTGDIIMAHNTHCDYSIGFISNVVLYMYPEGAIPFVMQTIPGLVSSSTDWFITAAGIVGCETTIAEINYKPDFESGVPYFFRIRKAMETAKSLDDYVSIMLFKNAGDYACSWLFGDINSGEILRLELAKETHDVQRTKDGLFYGMNSVFSPQIVAKETFKNNDMYDITTSSGCRNLRLDYLLNKDKIDLHSAKKILADHYDCVAKSDRKGFRSICKHKECEKGSAFNIAGAVDGKVVDSALARQMKFIGRFGSSCGRVFKKSDYPDGPWKAVTPNMPKYNWVTIRHK